jgi:orotate phosphoribosyltransferase
MQLLPTQDEVLRILRNTNALREGHFVYPNGLHSNEYLQVALAMRYYQHVRTLSVALSRNLRSHSEIRALLPHISVVTASESGLPVAYGVCEALRAHQVYWTEQIDQNSPLRFRQYLTPSRGEKVILVDDILRSGKRLTQAVELLNSYQAEVVALAVIVYQPTPMTPSFDPIPFYYVARLEASYYCDAASCEMCKRGIPADQVWV